MIVSPCKSNPPARLEAAPASRLPLLVRRGGRDIKKISRSSFDGADGVVVQLQEISSILIHHPVPGHMVATRLFLSARDTPPGQEGQSIAFDGSSPAGGLLLQGDTIIGIP